MLIGMWLTKFDIYQSEVAPNCLISHTNFWCPDFFQKEFLSDVRTEIHLIRSNIVSTGQSVQPLKIYILRLGLMKTVTSLKIYSISSESTIRSETDKNSVLSFPFKSKYQYKRKTRNIENQIIVILICHIDHSYYG